MLGKSNKKSVDTNMTVASSGATNSLTAGTTLEGKITTDNDIRVDGKLIGTLICKGKVIIGPQGHVSGDIDCTHAVIEGSFDGNLVVKELLNVRESAKIMGDIKTEKLLVQSGAIFNVTCSMGGQQLKSLTDSTKAS
jgi:cytoskeletal protein CcmA (bactofilin family)